MSLEQTSELNHPQLIQYASDLAMLYRELREENRQLRQVRSELENGYLGMVLMGFDLIDKSDVLLGNHCRRVSLHCERLATALELDEKPGYVHANVGLLHVLKRDLGQAMPSYGRAVALAPDDTQRIAIADLLDLLKRQPDLAAAHYALGFCYEKEGDWSAAREHYGKYVDAVKEGRFVERAKVRLKQLAETRTTGRPGSSR